MPLIHAQPLSPSSPESTAIQTVVALFLLPIPYPYTTSVSWSNDIKANYY